MKIPLQSFAQVVSALQRPPAMGNGQEKRQATRMNIETPVSVTLLAGGSGPRTIKAISRDISQSGIGLIMGSSVATGDRLVVHLPRKAQSAMLMLAVAKLCIELCDGVFKVGVEFTKELTSEELQNLRSSGEEMGRIQRSVLGAA